MSRFLPRVLASVMVWVCLLLGTVSAQQQTGDAQPSNQQAAGKEAVQIVLSRYIIDPRNLVATTGKALPSQGQWSISNGTSEVCPTAPYPCIQVRYRVSDVQVSCEWTVLLRGSTQTDLVLSMNEDAARYLVDKPHIKDTTDDQFRRKTLKTANPIYPAQARFSHVSGSVKVLTQIEADGHVGEATVISGPQLLHDAALTAVKQWQYEPLVVGSTAIRQQTLVVFNFNMASTGVRVF
ncbi:energy transducer TonB [Tunturiibacter gelidoferens]|uniref:TonB family protein n=1 Tax=Tunturiibacter gelidiferens TaxID=3069689 RepID=A0ACC5P5F7_9BACT|nr:energy transducer TonB [Edaphobacter lichenicola]MBB5341934.1 TonB family protein [Edaphobacter lichenicola]